MFGWFSYTLLDWIEDVTVSEDPECWVVASDTDESFVANDLSKGFGSKSKFDLSYKKGENL